MTKREKFEKKYHYTISFSIQKNCLTCPASLSEASMPYDILHCVNMPTKDNIVDEDKVCDQWD
jgi:hypothetical protein